MELNGEMSHIRPADHTDLLIQRQWHRHLEGLRQSEKIKQQFYHDLIVYGCSMLARKAKSPQEMLDSVTFFKQTCLTRSNRQNFIKVVEDVRFPDKEGNSIECLAMTTQILIAQGNAEMLYYIARQQAIQLVSRAFPEETASKIIEFTWLLLKRQPS